MDGALPVEDLRKALEELKKHAVPPDKDGMYTIKIGSYTPERTQNDE